MPLMDSLTEVRRQSGNFKASQKKLSYPNYHNEKKDWGKDYNKAFYSCEIQIKVLVYM